MKKRLLACLLILSLFVTGLGFVPAVQAAEDGISAQWTTKENLAPADQEVMLRPEKGDLSEDSASEITGESNQYQGPVAKNKFAAGPHLYSFSYRRQNFSPNCGKLFTFRACLRRLHRFGGA